MFHVRFLIGSGLAVAALFAALPGVQASAASRIVVIATGLENPRGLTVGSDHKLYVAEGGLGGTETTTPQ